MIVWAHWRCCICARYSTTGPRAGWHFTPDRDTRCDGEYVQIPATPIEVRL